LLWGIALAPYDSFTPRTHPFSGHNHSPAIRTLVSGRSRDPCPRSPRLPRFESSKGVICGGYFLTPLNPLQDHQPLARLARFFSPPTKFSQFRPWERLPLSEGFPFAILSEFLARSFFKIRVFPEEAFSFSTNWFLQSFPLYAKSLFFRLVRDVAPISVPFFNRSKLAPMDFDFFPRPGRSVAALR